MAKRKKALVLFSGGLDSRLVVKILEEQKLDVELIYFLLPFGCGCCNNLSCNFNFSQKEKAKLKIVDCTKGKLFYEYLEIIKNPKFGRGKGMNPCIDCRIFLLKKAKEYAVNKKIKIIATGEVLGERPMSQHSKALKIIDREVGFEVLRPLSAKLLPETSYEKEGLVNREKFFDIQGRRRKKQIELAKKFNIQYPHPAGGCLLCEKSYSRRLKDLLKNKEKISEIDIETLRFFRHFRSKFTNKKIIIGKNEKENLMLENLNKQLKWNIIIPEKAGPTAIFEDKNDKDLVLKLIEAYSSKNLEERKKFEEIKI